MKKGVYRRTPKNYDGEKPTSKPLSQLIPLVLEQISMNFSDRPDLILASWPEIIGPRLAPMTQAVSFIDGILLVKVKNSTLYSLLSQNDKPKLVQKLREKFPKILIKTILFRIG